MSKLLSFYFLLLSVSLFGQTDTTGIPFKLNQCFTALTDLKNFNGNVIVSKNGKVILNNTYVIKGQTDSLTVTKASRFIIASVSKVFIKYSILKLVESNTITLNDKVDKFIPGFPEGNKITVEYLMHHQSGLPRELANYESYDSLSLAKIVELAKAEKLQFEPGTKTLYSNVGYFLLHYIIDKASPKGYIEFIQKNIFDKMRLKHTSEFNATQTVIDFAYGFNNEEGKIVPSSKKSVNRFETGNYLSTIGDLYSFSNQFMSGNYLKKSLAIKMFNQDSTLVQAGGRPGYRSYLYKNLKTGVTFIFTANYTDIPIMELTGDIISIVAGKPYTVPHKINRKEIPVPAETLLKYTGKFALEADYTQTFSITLEKNKRLAITDKYGEVTEIAPDSETTFFFDPASKDGYLFTLNAQTRTYDLTIISTGLVLKAKRIE